MSRAGVKASAENPDIRAYHVGKLMRQAKPDDVFSFVTADEIGPRGLAVRSLM